jgi:transposase
MGRRRRRFSDEFKREAVRLAFEGSRPVSEVARELDVRPDLLRRWRRKLEGQKSGERSDVERENLQLRRQLRQTEEERDLRKKALAIFSDRPR